MSNLLINEPPLQVLPSLAKAIGLNEAIVLQQLHYWIHNKKVGKWENGQKWVRNTADEWQADNFPFWSVDTVRRILGKLEDMGLIASASLNKSAYDRTKWYTINYSKLADYQLPFMQSAEMNTGNLPTPIPETTSETTQTTNSSSTGQDYQAVVIAYENEIHPTLTPTISANIKRAMEEFGDSAVIEAIGIASKSGVRTWRYIEGILCQWRVNGRQPKEVAKKKPARKLRLVTTVIGADGYERAVVTDE